MNKCIPGKLAIYLTIVSFLAFIQYLDIASKLLNSLKSLWRITKVSHNIDLFTAPIKESDCCNTSGQFDKSEVKFATSYSSRNFLKPSKHFKKGKGFKLFVLLLNIFKKRFCSC